MAESIALWTEGEAFADWCAEFLIQSEDQFAGMPLVLEAWQREFFDEALTVIDPNSLEPFWKTVALIVARKNGKTALLAALALYRLFNDDGRPEILLAAGSDKQAAKLFNACINYLRQNDFLDGQVHRREYIGEIVHVASGGVIQRLPSSGETLDGANPSLAICDELHAWTTPTRRRVWASLNTAGGARVRTQVFTITTAGDASTRHSSILGRMIDSTEEAGEVSKPHEGLTIAKNEEGSTLLFNYSAPTDDPSDIEAMQLANPASWITDKFLAAQSAGGALTSAEVLQLHGCVWAAGEVTFVAPEVVAAAASVDSLEDGEKVVLGFDGSERKDETWLVAASLQGLVQPLARWARPAGAAEWRVPRSEVHAAIAAAVERFDVLEIAGDPPGWYAEIDAWTESYGEDRVVAFDTRQPQRMAPACERMKTGLEEQVVRFAGELVSVLVVHFDQCVVRETPFGVVVEKDSKDSPRKIDGAVASIIAYDRACWHAANIVERKDPVFAWA